MDKKNNNNKRITQQTNRSGGGYHAVTIPGQFSLLHRRLCLNGPLQGFPP